MRARARREMSRRKGLKVVILLFIIYTSFLDGVELYSFFYLYSGCKAKQ